MPPRALPQNARLWSRRAATTRAAAAALCQTHQALRAALAPLLRAAAAAKNRGEKNKPGEVQPVLRPRHGARGLESGPLQEDSQGSAPAFANAVRRPDQKPTHVGTRPARSHLRRRSARGPPPPPLRPRNGAARRREMGIAALSRPNLQGEPFRQERARRRRTPQRGRGETGARVAAAARVQRRTYAAARENGPREGVFSAGRKGAQKAKPACGLTVLFCRMKASSPSSPSSDAYPFNHHAPARARCARLRCAHRRRGACSGEGRGGRSGQRSARRVDSHLALSPISLSRVLPESLSRSSIHCALCARRPLRLDAAAAAAAPAPTPSTVRAHRKCRKTQTRGRKRRERQDSSPDEICPLNGRSEMARLSAYCVFPLRLMHRAGGCAIGAREAPAAQQGAAKASREKNPWLL